MELTSKFLTKGNGVPNPTETIEARLMADLNDPDKLDKLDDAVVQAIVKEITDNPRHSMMLMMGTNNLCGNGDILRHSDIKAERNMENHEKEMHTYFKEEQVYGRMRDEAQKELQQAQEKFDGINDKWERTKDMLASHEASYHHYKRRAKITKLFLQLTLFFVSDDFQPFANRPIEYIRHKVGVLSGVDCRALSRPECLAVLHILDVCGYANNPYFRGLWKIPPDGDVAHWIAQYGPAPQVKTSKAKDILAQLQERVAHYLGLKAPPVLDDPSGALEFLSDEQLNSLRLRATTLLLNRGAISASIGVTHNAGGEDAGEGGVDAGQEDGGVRAGQEDGGVGAGDNSSNAGDGARTTST